MSGKVIHLISSLSRGGRERQLATIVAHTDFNKYPTTIIFFNKQSNSYIDEYNLNNISVQVKPKRKINRLIELDHVLRREKPAVVYTWGSGESLIILLLYPFHNFRFINGSVRHGIRSVKFSHYFRTLILHLSRNIVSNSYSGLKANNLKRGKVLYNGIDNKFITPISDEYKIAKKKELFNIDAITPLLISVANFVPYKDYFSVLTALKMLKEEGHSFYYLILGDGPLRDAITQKICEYRLHDRIEMTGNVREVHDYLKLADIFIHSSKGEGCSNAILEAMAAGLPIIASDTGGTHEIVSDKNGFLFKYKDTAQLSLHIRECITDKRNRLILGENSLKIVHKRFSVDEMMNNYYDIVDQAN